MLNSFQEIKIRDFYNSYKGDCDIQKFTAIIVTFFQLMTLELLNGFKIKLPYLGTFLMEKHPPNKTVDYFKTNENKKNGINKVVYREPDVWFSYLWDKEISLRENTHAKHLFNFKSSKSNDKLIPKHKDILKLSYE